MTFLVSCNILYFKSILPNMIIATPAFFFFFLETQGQVGEWESFIMKKRGRFGVCFDGRLLEQGSWKQTNWKQGVLCDWSGEHIFF